LILTYEPDDAMDTTPTHTQQPGLWELPYLTKAAAAQLKEIPALDDWKAWRALQAVEDYSCVQLRITPHNTWVNFGSNVLYKRLRTDFADDKHDYYLDDVLITKKGDPASWPGPSGLNHRMFREFDAPFKAGLQATAKIRDLFYQHVLTEADIPRKPAPSLDVLWQTLVQKKPQRASAFMTQLQQTLFTTPGSRAVTTAAAQATQRFLDEASTWGQLPPNLAHAAYKDQGLVAKKKEWDGFQKDIQNAVKEEVLEQWRLTRDGGTERHSWYQAFTEHDPLPPGTVLPLGFIRAMAWLMKEYDVFGAEVPIFDEAAHVVGTHTRFAHNPGYGG
jgi:hypothetical protein